MHDFFRGILSIPRAKYGISWSDGVSGGDGGGVVVAVVGGGGTGRVVVVPNVMLGMA